MIRWSAIARGLSVLLLVLSSAPASLGQASPTPTLTFELREEWPLILPGTSVVVGFDLHGENLYVLRTDSGAPAERAYVDSYTLWGTLVSSTLVGYQDNSCRWGVIQPDGLAVGPRGEAYIVGLNLGPQSGACDTHEPPTCPPLAAGISVLSPTGLLQPWYSQPYIPFTDPNGNFGCSVTPCLCDPPGVPPPFPYELPPCPNTWIATANRDMTVSARGDVYVLDGNRVKEIGRTGALTTIYGPATCDAASLHYGDIAVNDAGQVFVLDEQEHQIRTFAPSGALRRTTPLCAVGPHCAMPREIAADKNTYLYVNDGMNIHVLSQTGAYLGWGTLPGHDYVALPGFPWVAGLVYELIPGGIRSCAIRSSTARSWV